MDQFNYIEEANVTMSDNYHRELVSQKALVLLLNEAIQSLDRLDKVKKALFYGRKPEGLYYLFNDADIQVHRLHNDPQKGINLLHGILGVATEAGEMLEALSQGLAGLGFDAINLEEEIGDNLWYNAALLRVLGTDFNRVQRKNIAKLRARFPDKFTEHDANNRDLNKERNILEAAPMKPIVQIKNWVIMGNVLFGTALNHPNGGGGETDVRTSRIVKREGNRVETLNTIYELIGDPAG